MKTSSIHLKDKLMAGMAAAVVGLTTTSLLFPSFALSQGQGNCEQGFVAKVEQAPFTYTHSEAITEVQVKAGSAQSTDGNQCTEFTSNGTNGAYEVTGLGTHTVTVSYVGSGPDQKEISHVEFYAYVGEAQAETEGEDPGATPSPEATPPASPSASPSASADPGASASASPSTSPSADPGATTDGGSNSSSGTAQNQTGQVLGVKTLAKTGTMVETIVELTMWSNVFLTFLSSYGYIKTRKNG